VVMYLGVRGFIEVPVPSQESEWSCIYVLGVLLKCPYQDSKVSGHVFRSPKYMTTHFPGLVRALQ
jgi:hypothetical protein